MGKKWTFEERLSSMCFQSLGKSAEIAAPTGCRNNAAPTSATIQKPTNGDSAKTTIATTSILMMFLMISTQRKPHRSGRRPLASSKVSCQKFSFGRCRIPTDAPPSQINPSKDRPSPCKRPRNVRDFCYGCSINKPYRVPTSGVPDTASEPEV